MPQASRLGDMNTGEPCFPPTANISASTDTFVNNLGSIRVGDPYLPHNCGTVVHPIKALKGSSSVFINNKQAIRQGDSMDCNPINFAHIGSPDVNFGG